MMFIEVVQRIQTSNCIYGNMILPLLHRYMHVLEILTLTSLLSRHHLLVEFSVCQNHIMISDNVVLVTCKNNCLLDTKHVLSQQTSIDRCVKRVSSSLSFKYYLFFSLSLIFSVRLFYNIFTIFRKLLTMYMF